MQPKSGILLERACGSSFCTRPCLRPRVVDEAVVSMASETDASVRAAPRASMSSGRLDALSSRHGEKCTTARYQNILQSRPRHKTCLDVSGTATGGHARDVGLRCLLGLAADVAMTMLEAHVPGFTHPCPQLGVAAHGLCVIWRLLHRSPCLPCCATMFAIPAVTKDPFCFSAGLWTELHRGAPSASRDHEAHDRCT
jgi:hypothetical protein